LILDSRRVDNRAAVLALKNLLRRKVRTLLSVFGVAIGIGAIVAFHAIARGFKEGLDQYFRESGADLMVLDKTVQDPAFSRISKEQQDFVRAMPEVEHLSRGTFTIAAPRALRMRQSMPALLVFGRTPGERLLEKHRTRLEGRLIERDDEVMVGSVAAEYLGVKPGDPLTLFGREFKVVGVYGSGVSFETVGAVVPNEVVQQQLGMGDKIAMGFVYLRAGADWRAVKAAIEKEFGRLSVIRVEEFGAFYGQLEYIDWFVWIVSLVSVVVGALGVLNTMLMSVSERTREIGTLRAVGWSRGLVLRLILAEGALISAVGGLVGLAVGAVGAEVLVRWAPQGFLEARFSGGLFAQAFAVALALGFAGALYPAWAAGRLSPIEALKYE
jgi:ABC-type antimicrobial peptide transport system permease subunit